MAELPALSVRITTDTTQFENGMARTEGRLGRLRGSIRQSEQQFIRYGAAIAAAGASFAALNLVRVSREFGILNAQLVTATGSAEGAERAFAAIQDFAATTPFDLQQATTAFTQLVNLGLTPSERALRSYGNTASALGKDLSQFVEAVADAATFEFERLKEFGIRARQENDSIAFTFQGVTTQIGKNAAEIEEFLIGIGENQFAGALEARLQTLDGAISNLGDSWDQLLLTVSQQGAGNVITDSVRLATGALDELTTQIESGQLAVALEAFTGQFSGIADDISSLFDGISIQADQLGVDIGGAFSNLPQNVRAFIQIMTVEIASFIERAGAFGQEIADRLRFWDGDTFDIDTRIEQLNEARRNSIETILQERDAAVESFETQIQQSEQLRQAFEEEQAAKAAARGGEDRLEEFGQVTEVEAGARTQRELEEQQKQLENLRVSLMSETQALQEKLENDQVLIDQALLDKQISTEQAQDLERQSRERHEKALTDITQRENARQQRINQNRINAAGKALGDLSTLMNSESRKQFEIGKKAAIAQTTIDTFQAAQSAFSSLAGIPIIGPALGAAAAAAAIVAGNQRISSIRSQSFGGGGGATSGGGAAQQPVPQGATASGGGAAQNELFVRGIDPSQMFTGQQLVDIINQAQQDGAVLRV